jgi:hypothetical protein
MGNGTLNNVDVNGNIGFYSLQNINGGLGTYPDRLTIDNNNEIISGSLTAGTNITLDKVGADITINAAGGGGGDTSVFSSTKALAMEATGNAFVYRTNIASTSYATTNQSLINNGIMAIPVIMREGDVLNDLGFNIATAVAGGTVQVGLYNTTLNADGNMEGGDLLQDLGAVDISTTGLKFITDLNYTLPSTEENLYFVVISNRSGSSTAILAAGFSSTVPALPYTAISGTTMYRFGMVSATYTVGGPLPPDIHAANHLFTNPGRFPIIFIKN